MSSDKANRPRLSIDLTDEQYTGLTRVPWGLMRPLFSAIVDDLNSLMDKGLGDQIVSVIVSGMMKPRELLKTLKVEDQDGI